MANGKCVSRVNVGEKRLVQRSTCFHSQLEARKAAKIADCSLLPATHAGYLKMSASPLLRTLPDRIRQVALFEVGGLLLITPPFIWLSGVPVGDAIVQRARNSLLAALWNAAYNTGFDWLDGRLSGRTADRRPLFWRVVHAIGFEAGLLLVSLPIIVYWIGMDWLAALVADLALALAYTAYAFVFNLAYDRIYPIAGNAQVTLTR